MLLLCPILIFRHFFNNYSRFLKSVCFLHSNFHVAHTRFLKSLCFPNSNFHLAHLCSFHRIDDLSDKIFIENQVAIKTNQLTDSCLSNQMLTFKIGA